MAGPEIPSGTMFEEAAEILETAKGAGVALKLIGGWAIQLHCTEHDFCDRDHPDIDFVGLRSQYEGIVRVMEQHGYIENRNMTMATSVTRLLFEKPDSPDHIDVFLDFIDIEHFIDLKDRLEIEEDTLSVSDLLIIKATISRLNEKDVRDIVTMVKDLEVGTDDSPGLINKSYIAELCAKRWGLHHDVLAALKKSLSLLSRYNLPNDVEDSVRERLESIVDAIESHPKSVRWRLRGLLGERVAWRRPVETDRVTVDHGAS
ncbi:hypothetical protein EU545_05330 [Candidatus Thorarchaeota archaeon]|nr:MAG: hypothetical protein EU545_05330 [Candidatus Thorarchaeota archaeon]